MSTVIPNIKFPEAIVLAGGGAKSMSALGALHVLKKCGKLKNAKIFAGTSAGSIVAAGMSLDRDPIEMVKKFTEYSYRSKFDIQNFGNAFGLDTGENLSEWIDLVIGPDPLTFQDIYDKNGTTLIVCATNLSQSRAEYFSRHMHPDMDVRIAIRMSCSLPGFFTAVRYNDEIFVDGALSDPFPYEHVSSISKNVLGIRYESSEYKSPMKIEHLQDFIKSLIVVTTKDKFPIDGNIFTINVGDLSVLDFKDSKKLKKSFKLGFTAMKDFIKKND